MTGARTAIVRDRAAGDLVHPGREPLLVAQLGKPALHAEEDILDDVVDVTGGHASGHERAQLAGHILPGHRRAAHEQHSGPQQVRATPGLTAWMVAEARPAARRGSSSDRPSPPADETRTSTRSKPAS